MMTNKREHSRRLVSFRRFAQRFVNVIGLICVVGVFFLYAPLDLFRASPATGGDMGCHFWTLKLLAEHALPDWSVRSWNPGNHAGEPRLLHYFPLPFLVMALLGKFLSLGMAFNWGTLLGFVFLPLSVFFCFRGIGSRFPIPILTAACSLLFTYNESFTMWGGNGLSTLAGQFAHGYGLLFLLFGIGALGSELRRKKKVLWSALFFAASVLSHGYPALCIPLVLLLFVLGPKKHGWKERLNHCFQAGFFALLLSLWFVIPMLLNKEWQTEFIITWDSPNLLAEALPEQFYPFALISGIVVLGFGISSVFSQAFRLHCRRYLRLVAALFVGAAYYIGLYFVLPKFGLIDVRALPHVELLLCFLCGLSIGAVFQLCGSLIPIFGSVPAVLLLLWWSDLHVQKFPSWLSWNYSGWETKELYPQLEKLSQLLRRPGGFSEPRVLYELSAVNNATGTLRVFEMLPYFAERATLESVYLEATQFSPLAVYLQAEVSRQPSCPFRQYRCPAYDVRKIHDRLMLTGTDEIILLTPETIAQAREAPFLEEEAEIKPWTVFRTKDEPQLVELLPPTVQFLEGKDWKQPFYDWFTGYKLGDAPIISVVHTPAEVLEKLHRADTFAKDENCNAHVEVSVDHLVLKTSCPGKAHMLKFNYHPAWKASSGDPLFLVSPGYMGIIPSKETVELRFGVHPLWRISSWLSWIALFWLIAHRVWYGGVSWKKSKKISLE